MQTNLCLHIRLAFNACSGMLTFSRGILVIVVKLLYHSGKTKGLVKKTLHVLLYYLNPWVCVLWSWRQYFLFVNFTTVSEPLGVALWSSRQYFLFAIRNFSGQSRAKHMVFTQSIYAEGPIFQDVGLPDLSGLSETWERALISGCGFLLCNWRFPTKDAQYSDGTQWRTQELCTGVDGRCRVNHVNCLRLYWNAGLTF